eukprot:g1498.t1
MAAFLGLSRQESKELSDEGRRLLQGEAATIAIDFGTARTGFAYQFTGGADEDGNKNAIVPSSFVELSAAKEPTALYRRVAAACDSAAGAAAGAAAGGAAGGAGREGFKLVFGQAAIEAFAEDQESYGYDDDDDMIGFFFDRFKMHLWGSESRRSGWSIQIKDKYHDKDHELIDIIADVLRHTKDLALKELSSFSPTPIDPSNVRWALTVPAIWDDFGKKFMRRAAFKAGLINNEQSERLVLALEPEAASLAVGAGQDLSGKLLRQGSKYMVLDCGGGTTDITVHEVRKVKPQVELSEVISPTGGDWGGCKVDEEFIKFFSDFTQIQDLKATAAGVQVLKVWELQKLTMTLGQAVSIAAPSTLLVDIAETGKTFRSLSDEYNQRHPSEPDIVVKRTRIVIPFATVQSFYKPVVDKIAAHAKELMRKPELVGTSYIVMVGGFSKSDILFEAVKEACAGEGVAVVKHPQADAAIVEGGVRFANNPTTIRDRVAKLTYGVNCVLKYDKDMDEGHEDDKFWRDDKKEFHVYNRFSKFVSCGDKLELDQEVTKNYSPVQEDAQNVTFDIYTSRHPKPRWVTDAGCSKLSSVSIAVTGSGDRRKQNLKVTFAFGDTEIKVKVENESGRTSLASLDFE